MIQEHHPQSIFALFILQLALGSLLVIALLNGRRDLVLLTLSLLAIMSAARIWSRIGLRRLWVQVSVDRCRLFPQEPLLVTAHLENRKWLPVRARLAMSFDRGLRPAEGDAARECGLLWHQCADFQWEVRALKRGVYHLGSAHLRAGDYFGFYLRARQPERPPLEVIVYPRLRRAKPLTCPRKDFFGALGVKSPVQDPIYLLGTRDYQGWQPARTIHWKASARQGRLQQKVFEPSAQTKTLLLVDAASFALHDARDDFEVMLETAAAIAVECDRNGQAVGFITNGAVEGGAEWVPVSRGPHQLAVILETMARLKMSALRPLEDLLLHGRPLPWGVGAVCFTYEADEALRSVEHLFRLRRVPLAFILCRRSAEGHAPAGALTLDEMALEAAQP